jgi:hypothetical protein
MSGPGSSSDEQADDDPQSRFVLVDDVDTLEVALETLSTMEVTSVAIDAEGAPCVLSALAF